MKLATLCYVKRDGKTLMIYRNKRHGDIHIGKWNGLGGKIHLGETPEECVIREVKEESGFEIKEPSLRGILTFPAFKDEEDWYVYVFIATEFSGKLMASQEGELKWVDDHELLKLPLWEGDPIFLNWLNEGRFFSGKFIYQNGKFLGHDVVFHDWVVQKSEVAKNCHSRGSGNPDPRHFRRRTSSSSRKALRAWARALKHSGMTEPIE